MLSSDERARADAFQFERHRARYVACRGRLRELLSAYLGREPASVGLVEGPNGKPRLEQSELRFNVAHSESLGLCAIATVEVGVDVEVVERERRPDWAAVAARFFHPDELADAGDWVWFLRTWTLKEACLKATGLGLLTDPRSFSVAHVLAGETNLVPLDSVEWLAYELAPLDGAVAAVAIAR